MLKKKFDNFIDVVNKINTVYIEKWKYRPSSFIRIRKLPAKTLTLQILSNKGRTTKMELHDFYREYNLNGDVSVWGYEKRRLEFNPLMIHEMNSDFLKANYSDNDSLLKLNGYLVLAVDGSDIKVPATKENYKKYGCQIRKNVSQENEPCMASISCIYDCLNKYSLDCQINKFKYSERDSALSNVDNAKKIINNKAIYIFDRGYTSFDLMYKLKDDKFLFRIQKRHFTAEQRDMKSDDELFTDVFRKERRMDRYAGNHEKIEQMRNNPVDLRFVRIHLDNGEDEFLVTNLTVDEFSTEAIGELYHLRWNIESSYRTMKSQMNLEEFSGYLSNIIEQDIYACVIMYNLTIANIQDNFLLEDEGRYRYKMQVNMNFSIGIIKSLFIKIILAKSKTERNRLNQELKESINRYCLPIRENRTYKRKRNTKNKCSMGYKYSY